MEALDFAEQITFIGYSLRETDFLAEFLFRQSITQGLTERKITIVDPNASELLPRFRDAFSPPGVIVDFDLQNRAFLTYANECLFTEVKSPYNLWTAEIGLHYSSRYTVGLR